MTPRVAAVAKLEPSSQESAQLRRNEQGRKNSGSMTPRLMLTRQAMVPLARQLAVSMPIMTKTASMGETVRIPERETETRRLAGTPSFRAWTKKSP